MKRFLSLCLLTTVLLAGTGCSLSFNREKRIRVPIKADYSVPSDEFKQSMSELLGKPFTDGNHVVELLNGDQIFPAMLEAIRGAKTSITMEKYIWSSGKISDPFVEALSERAQAGVAVYIIADALGSIALKKKDIMRMKESGVHFVKYNNPISFRFLRASYRTHRKILMVDGRIGFTGGVCISDDWQGNAEPPYWRDTHFRIEGPVVGQMQGVFMDNWLQTQSEVLHGKTFFPKPEKAGSMAAQFVESGPREEAENTRLAYLLAIASARKNIRISQPYFAPDTLMIDTLVAARQRGVDVQIIVPSKIDNVAVRKASRPRWVRLLNAGARFYEYQTTLYHCKIMIVDDLLSIVGSVNFDERSFRINDEANLHVLDEAFAATLVKTFEDDRRQSKELTIGDLKKQNFLSKIFDHFAGLFRSQL